MDKHLKTLSLCKGMGPKKIATLERALRDSGLAIVPSDKIMTIGEMVAELKKKGYRVSI